MCIKININYTVKQNTETYEIIIDNVISTCTLRYTAL